MFKLLLQTTLFFCLFATSLSAQNEHLNSGADTTISPEEDNVPYVPSLQLVTTDELICAGVSVAHYQVRFSNGSLFGPAQLSGEGLPADVDLILSATTANDGDIIDLDLVGIEQLEAGWYDFNLLAQDATREERLSIQFEIVADPIANVLPLNGANITIKNDGRGLIEFTYDAVSEALYYVIQGDEFGDINNGLALSRIVDFGQVAPGVMITFRVLAILADTTLVSCSKTITFVAPLPVEWQGVQVRAVERGLEINWQVLQDGQGDQYIIERQSGLSERIERIAAIADNGQVGPQSYSYINEQIQSGQIYYYRVLQKDLDGLENYSPWRTGRSHDTQQSFNYQLAPNPAKEEVQLLNLPEGEVVIFRLFDLQGHLISSGHLNQNQSMINLRELAQGIYHIEILQRKGEQQNYRLIKQ